MNPDCLSQQASVNSPDCNSSLARKTLLILLLAGMTLYGQAQKLGFQETECGLIPNPDYHYDNSSLGSHGSTYTLYHYATPILSKSNYLGAVSGCLLKFTGDAGWFMDNASSEYSLYKIAGNSCTRLGSGAGFSSGLYILNDHVSYLAIDFNMYGWPRKVTIERCSDIMHSKDVISDSVPDSNMTVHDTIPGMPLCSDLTELHFRTKSGADTLTYTIVLHADTALYAWNPEQRNNLFFPNPAQDYITLQGLAKYPNAEVSITGITGIRMKTSMLARQDNPVIYVGDLPNGVYLVIVRSSLSVFYTKMIKI